MLPWRFSWQLEKNAQNLPDTRQVLYTHRLFPHPQFIFLFAGYEPSHASICRSETLHRSP